MADPLQTSVIIVGGSIVGLSSALFLATQRVPFILIERHLSSSPHPRAIGWTHRTMELFRSVGLDAAIPVPKEVPRVGRPRRVATKTLNGEWSEEVHWTKPNGADQTGSNKPGATSRGPPPPVDTSSFTPVREIAPAQDELEPIIRTKVLELGGDLRLGYKMTSWSQSEDGVSVTAAEADGTQLTVHGKYLIACDGARSGICKDLGVGSYGFGYMRTLRSILFRCPSIDHYLSRGIQQWSIKNDDMEAFMVTYSDGRWALMSYDAGQDSLDEDGQKAYIQKAIGEEVKDIKLLSQGKWDLIASIADSFSSGRVFLAGDAAHALPPSRGGWGANTGIADAHNLAWKLAAVLSGASKPSLLDTYDTERRPVARVRHDQIFARDDYKAHIAGSDWEKNNKPPAIIDDVSMELGQLYRSTAILGSEDAELPDARTPAQWAGQPGTRAPHIPFRRPREDSEISSLDLFGQGWVVLSENSQWRDPEIPFIQVGQDVLEVESGAFAKAFGLDDATGAVLVRPDGYIAARWPSAVDNPLEDLRSASALVAHRSK
ncbi:2,4-dichlorophenol 6-monooxygenase [Xylariaceae sp. AK1471]|nr:2,4-dichlorophenol 6-monooxygenase [Xylariaceae sp. AK1471]